MQTPVPLLAGLLLALACGGATAQVTVDPHALDQLQPSPGAPNGQAQHPAKPPPARPAQQHPGPAKPSTSAAAHPPAPAPAAPAPPLVPVAPPAPPVIPAPVAVPVRPTQAPPLPAVAADAPGIATAIHDGLRLTFGADRADLNPATDAALRALVHDAASSPGTTFTITAFAAGTPEDPSAPRRLSLSRALAVRSVLIHEGVASIHIYVKALGATSPGIADGPADRADIVIGGTPSEASAQAPAPAKATP